MFRRGLHFCDDLWLQPYPYDKPLPDGRLLRNADNLSDIRSGKFGIPQNDRESLSHKMSEVLDCSSRALAMAVFMSSHSH